MRPTHFWCMPRASQEDGRILSVRPSTDETTTDSSETRRALPLGRRALNAKGAACDPGWTS